MPTRPARPRLKAGQIRHFDPQQCWSEVNVEHVHDPCRCDPDAPYDVYDDELAPADRQWNTRAHIKQQLGGHWPLTDAQDVVICDRCEGAIVRDDKHRKALDYQPLPAR